MQKWIEGIAPVALQGLLMDFGGISRRTAALAENPLRARKLDDVVHGQEVRLVFEIGNERKLVFDEPSSGSNSTM